MTRERKNLDIQALRGVSILLVMTGHYCEWLPTRSWSQVLTNTVTFYVGVDLFFAISGFVIAKNIFEHAGDLISYRLPWVEFKRFWIRRFFRLMPSAWLWLGIGVAVATLFRYTFQTSAILAAKSAVFAVFGLANFYWANCWAHATLSLCGHPDVNGFYWSLSLEEQCYLELSLFGMFLGYRWLAVLAIFALLVQAVLPRSFASWLWVTRTDAFFWGVLLYGFSRTAFYKNSARRFKRRWLMAVTGVALTVLVLTLKQTALWDLYGLGLSLVGFAAGVCVWAAAYDHGCFGHGWLAASFVWIGDRSYSLYLSHLLVFMLLHQTMMAMNMEPLLEKNGAEISLLVAPVAALLAFWVAHINYIWIEQPFRKFGRSLT